jgi:hypothetical protein
MELNHLVLSAKKLEPPVEPPIVIVSGTTWREPLHHRVLILRLLSFLQEQLMPDERMACYKPG